MPEGPSIIIATEAMKFLAGKKVTKAKGNAKIDIKRLEGKKITAFKTWGKHILICFEDFTVRVHFLMFGTYLIDDEKTTPLKLGLTFGKSHQLNIYTSAIKILDEPLDAIYNWEDDIMSEKWDEKKAIKKLSEQPLPICDVLVDQEIFSGAGNIIKNETLYNLKLHPESIAAKLPPAKKKALATEVKRYAYDFLKWRKAGTFAKHWLAYEQKICKRCDLPLHKEHMGKGKRVTYYCNNCQVKY